MERRRRTFALVACAVASVLGLAAACSFPDVSFGNGASEGGLADTGAMGADSGPGSPVGANEDVDPGGGNKDATVAPEGGQRVDAGADAMCCDCDDDMVRGDSGPSGCGFPSGDCDDLNKYVHPNAGFVASVSWETSHTPTYDWDCDGVVVKQYPYGVGACASHNKLQGCSKFQGGFEGDPACGVAGHYVTVCANDPTLGSLGCVETMGDTRTQGCH